MVVCTFCGSENVRPSGSSALDAPGKRIVRALTFQRLYRCRSCDALFEAILGGGKRQESNAASPQENLRKGPGSIESRVDPLKIARGN